MKKSFICIILTMLMFLSSCSVAKLGELSENGLGIVDSLSDLGAGVTNKISEKKASVASKLDNVLDVMDDMPISINTDFNSKNTDVSVSETYTDSTNEAEFYEEEIYEEEIYEEEAPAEEVYEADEAEDYEEIPEDVYMADKTENYNDIPADNYYADDGKRLVIAIGGLRIRDKPSIETGKKVGLVPDGSIVTVYRTENDWAYVCYDGTYGWCSGEFLFMPSYYDMSPIRTAIAQSKDDIVLNTDKYKGTRNIISSIPNGEIVYIYKFNGNRAFVSYRNIYGWCSADCLAY